MDITWALLRMKLACLMKRGISPGNMPQVFSWGGNQSILNPSVLRLWKVGYCPMIEGYGTDFTTAYTVLKHAQMVGDVWKQNGAGITSDVAIFIQAKQIQMKCPEEFSNTVDRLGRLHISLKYWSMLAKKFRFYVSDLGNIWVYGLMIYITIFLMIFDNLTFPDTKQSGVKLVLGIQCLIGEQFRRSFATIRDSSEKIQKEIRSAWTEVSSNNMLTIIIRPFIHHTSRECLRRAFFRPAIHSDHKRPKVAEKDSSIFSENTPVKEGKNLLSKMCTLDAVMIGRPLSYGKTNDIVVFFFKKCSNFLCYKCRKWHLKDDSTILSEDLNMDVTWALLRMQLPCLMKSGISPGNMQQVLSWGGYQSILNPAVLRLWKIGYCPMIEGYGADFTTVYTVLKHAQKVGDVWNRTMQESRLMWPSAAKENKFKRSVPKNFQTPWILMEDYTSHWNSIYAG